MVSRASAKRNGLHDAAESGTYRDLSKALSPKLVNQQTALGKTPLHLATAKNRWWVIRELLHLQADPNIQDDLGDTPLHIASRERNVCFMLLLSSGKANIQIKNSHSETPFQVAVKSGNYGAVKALLDRKLVVDVNERDSLGRTPLHVAVERGDGAIAKVLIDFKADIHALTNERETPLQLALKMGHSGKMMNLLSYKVQHIIPGTVSDLLELLHMSGEFCDHENPSNSSLATSRYMSAMYNELSSCSDTGVQKIQGSLSL